MQLSAELLAIHVDAWERETETETESLRTFTNDQHFCSTYFEAMHQWLTSQVVIQEWYLNSNFCQACKTRKSIHARMSQILQRC